MHDVRDDDATTQTRKFIALAMMLLVPGGIGRCVQVYCKKDHDNWFFLGVPRDENRACVWVCIIYYMCRQNVDHARARKRVGIMWC